MDLNATNVALSAQSGKRAGEWNKLISDTLQEAAGKAAPSEVAAAASSSSSRGQGGAAIGGAGDDEYGGISVPWTESADDVTADAAAGGMASGGGDAKSKEEAIRAPVVEDDGRSAFVQVGQATMVGIHVVVFTKRSLLPQIGGVQRAQVATGVMGLMGNKGGVAVRLRVDDTTLCFICAHLAAHRSAVAARNADYNTIMGRLTFETPIESADLADVVAKAAAGRSGAAVDALLHPAGAESESGRLLREMTTLRPEDHDLVVFLGDLNYRVVEAVSVAEALALAKAGEFEPLLARDQLTRERLAANAFHGFSEAAIHFPATYKYRVGTDSYDDRIEKKPRAPAWCDRVLWRSHRSREPQSTRPLLYHSTMERISDHKPVHLLLETDVRRVERRRREVVRAEVLAEANAHENDAVPKVCLSTLALDLGRVGYGRTVTRTVTLRNTSRTGAAWRFAPKPGDIDATARWLRVTPIAGYTPPAHEVSITLTASVGPAEARAAAEGVPTLDDTLILRVEGGSDHYLTVGGSVQATAFGCSLAQLVRMREPARDHVLTSDGPLPRGHWAALRALGDVAAATADPSTGATASAEPPLAPPGSAADVAAARRGSASSGAAADAPPASRPRPVTQDLGPQTVPAWQTSGRGGDPAKSQGSAEPPSSLTNSSSLSSSSAATAATVVTTGISGVELALPAPLPVPKEVVILVDRILRPGMTGTGAAAVAGDGAVDSSIDGLHATGLFSVAPDPAEAALCRECVDTSRHIPSDAASSLAAAATLIELLASLREPVIPPHLFPGSDLIPHSQSSVRHWCASMLSLLPAVSYNTVIYILSVLREALKPEHASHSGVTPASLSAAIAPVLFRRTVVAAGIDPTTAMAGLRDATGAASALGPARRSAVEEAEPLAAADRARIEAVIAEMLTCSSLRM